MAEALGRLVPADRLRLVPFATTAREADRRLDSGDAGQCRGTIRTVDGLTAGGSANLFDGMRVALRGLDDDRASSLLP